MTQLPSLLLPSLRRLGVTALLLALAGCGFTLRGSVDLPEPLRTLEVVSLDDGGELLQQVRRALRNSGVNLVEQGSDYRLGLGREVTDERIVSVNANARAGEYEVEMSLQFQLTRAGEAVLGPDTLRLTRVYLTDPENAVAKEEEAELIRSELRRELAQQLLRRLQAAPV
jgi:LPS-assembly lipoprotein